MPAMRLAEILPDPPGQLVDAREQVLRLAVLDACR